MRLLKVVVLCGILVAGCTRHGSEVIGGGAGTTTYEVGPGRTYADLQAVAGLLNPGDTVNVYAKGSAYAGGLVLERPGTAASKIKINGIRQNGQRPQIAGGTNTVELLGDHYELSGFDLTGGTTRVVFHHADDITIRDSVVHDCPAHGILGAETDSGSLTLDYVEVHHCGSGTQKHPIYVDSDQLVHPGSVFRMQHCYLHDQLGGNGVKSRAERNEFYYNWFEGGFYREIELIGPTNDQPALKREDSDIVGNVFVKTQGSNVARIGGDGDADTSGRYRFVNNTFILKADSPAIIQVFDQVESLEMHNNIFYRQGGGGVQVYIDSDGIWVGGKKLSGSNNWLQAGSTSIPSEWTGSLQGVDPGFRDLAAHDFRPSAAAPVVDAGIGTTVSPATAPFPAPLDMPLSSPPVHQLENLGAAVARVAIGVDIGAFDANTPMTTGGTPPTNTPPTVRVSRVGANALVAPATVQLVATANDADGTVAKIEFYVDGALVGTDDTSPYTVSWSAAQAGAFSVTAKAFDNSGASTVSTPMSLNVTATAVCEDLVAGHWVYVDGGAHFGQYVTEVDVTPATTSGTVFVGAAHGHTQDEGALAAAVEFGNDGTINARSGANYMGGVPYDAGTAYHVRLVINPAARSYTAFVKKAGEAEAQLGANLAFRQEQSASAVLDTLAVTATGATARVCQ